MNEIIDYLFGAILFILKVACIIGLAILFWSEIDSLNPCSRFSRHGTCESGRL